MPERILTIAVGVVVLLILVFVLFKLVPGL